MLFAGMISSLAAQQFVDVSTTVGLSREARKSWGNPVWGDINNDGFLDLIVPTHGLASSGGPFVYLNAGGDSFSDIRETSGIQQGPELDDRDWHGFSFGDFDGDGNLDLYVSEGAKGQVGGTVKRDLLFQGNGDGTFHYASDTAGIQTSMNRGRCGFWFDYDNDGQLDLFVKNFSSTNILYKNNGAGLLSPVASAGGLAQETFGVDFGSIVGFADYDLDGRLDIAISGDGNTLQLYHNEGNGTFVNVTLVAGLFPQVHSKGLAWGDYDNDGLPDLFVARAHQGEPGAGISLYHNNGNGSFAEVTESAGVSLDATCWAGVWGDYDNDGFLDLFVTNAGDLGQGPGNGNRLFHNNGNGTFTNRGADAGVNMKDGVSLHKVAAWADYNNDGFLDLLVKDGAGGEEDNGPGALGRHFLFKNQGNENHFLKIKLKGTQSNLRGLGARVEVTSSIGTMYRQNDGGAGGSYASQSSEPLHFGIGAATTAKVEINWPSGVVDTLRGVKADTTMTVIEGSHSPSVQAQNISTRLDVKTGAKVGIGGFIVTGSGNATVLLRGLGPSLTSSGVQGVLANPVLELHSPDGTVVTNDNWRDTQAAAITATGVAPSNDAEAALVANLQPGAYTAVLSGRDDGTGIGLLEIYKLGDGVVTELANISTRGFAGIGSNVLIGGVIIGPAGAAAADLVVRAIGPTLADLGVSGSLPNPTLELHDQNGVVIASNNDWQDDPTQAAKISAVGLAPGDSRESALEITVPTGSYTAVVRGNNEQTGVALVEVYKLD